MTGRPRGSQTTTCKANRGLQQPLAGGHLAVSARLTYAVTDVGIADHSSIAGDLPQRPASDEERLYDPHQKGRAPLDAAQRRLVEGPDGKWVSIRRWEPLPRRQGRELDATHTFCEVKCASCMGQPHLPKQQQGWLCRPVASQAGPDEPWAKSRHRVACCAQLSGSASGAKVGERGAVSCEYSPTSRGDLHGTPKGLGSRR